jgi:hypothetical protein
MDELAVSTDARSKLATRVIHAETTLMANRETASDGVLRVGGLTNVDPAVVVAHAIYVIYLLRPATGHVEECKPGRTMMTAAYPDSTMSISPTTKRRFLAGTRARSNCGAPKPTTGVGKILQHAMQRLSCEDRAACLLWREEGVQTR